MGTPGSSLNYFGVDTSRWFNPTDVSSTANLYGGSNTGSSWFGNSGILNGLVNLGGLGLQGYFGLQSAKLAKEQLGLAKNQFGFEKALTNRNLANQAQIINNAYANAAQASAGLIGSMNPDGTFGSTDPAVAQRIIDSAKEKYVEGSPIR